MRGPGTLARNEVEMPPGSEVEGDVVGPVVLHERPRLPEHLARRLAEGDRQQALLLAHALARAQEERNAAPAPVVDLGAQRDEGLGLRVRVHAVGLAVAVVLAAD